MHRILSILTISLLIVSCQKADESKADKAIQVNGEWISKKQIDEASVLLRQEMLRYKPEQAFEGVDESTRKNAARQLMANILMLQEADRRGIKIDESRFEEEYSGFKEQFGDKATFTRMLTESGITEEAMKKQLRNGMKLDSLMKILLSDVDTVGMEAVSAYYNENKGIFTSRKQVHSAQIVLLYGEDTTATHKSQMLEKAKGIVQQLRKGADFASLAKQYSQGPSSKNGGDIGWLSKGDLREDIENTLFSLEVGDISGPIVTESGILILKNIEEKQGKQKEQKEVEGRIRTLLEIRERNKIVSNFIDSLVREADIVYADPNFEP